MKTSQIPLYELSHKLVFNKAKLIDNEYKLSIDDLTQAEKLTFLDAFLSFHTNIDAHIQEYLNHACQDRMYAENESFGGFDE